MKYRKVSSLEQKELNVQNRIKIIAAAKREHPTKN